MTAKHRLASPAQGPAAAAAPKRARHSAPADEPGAAPARRVKDQLESHQQAWATLLQQCSLTAQSWQQPTMLSPNRLSGQLLLRLPATPPGQAPAARYPLLPTLCTVLDWYSQLGCLLGLPSARLQPLLLVTAAAWMVLRLLPGEQAVLAPRVGDVCLLLTSVASAEQEYLSQLDGALDLASLLARRLLACQADAAAAEQLPAQEPATAAAPPKQGGCRQAAAHASNAQPASDGPASSSSGGDERAAGAPGVPFPASSASAQSIQSLLIAHCWESHARRQQQARLRRQLASSGPPPAQEAHQPPAEQHPEQPPTPTRQACLQSPPPAPAIVAGGEAAVAAPAACKPAAQPAQQRMGGAAAGSERALAPSAPPRGAGTTGGVAGAGGATVVAQLSPLEAQVLRLLRSQPWVTQRFKAAFALAQELAPGAQGGEAKCAPGGGGGSAP